MTQPNPPDQQASRRELLAAINAGIDVGLPAPSDIYVGTFGIHLDSAADLCGWADWFGYASDIPATFGQPHPNLADAFQSDEWLTNVYFDWRGQTLRLGAKEPITEEQRRHWVDSGRAADFAEPADDPTGLTYSREQDDPTPVSPARGGLVHRGGVVASGELVDETPAEASTAAIYFSEAYREAFRLARQADPGHRSSPELRTAAALDLLHGQALAEDAERTRRADVREGEQGRVTNLDVARFLAMKEEKSRTARRFLGLEESAAHHPVESVVEVPASGLTPAADLSRGPLAAPCAWALLMDRLEALDSVPMVVAAQHCTSDATDRVRFDRPDLGVWAVLVGELCEGHTGSAVRLGGIHLGAIPRHASASP